MGYLHGSPVAISRYFNCDDDAKSKKSFVVASRLNTTLTSHDRAFDSVVLHLPTPAMARDESLVVNKYRGVEDIRMHQLQSGAVLLTGNMGRTVNKNTHVRTIYSAELDGHWDNLIVLNEKVLLPSWTNNTQTEKNWTPFESGGKLMYIYSVNPHIIIGEKSTNTLSAPFREMEKLYETQFVPVLNSKLYGGSNAVQVGNVMMTCAHTKSRGKDYKTVLYTFSRTPPFQVLAVVPALLDFNHAKIQYCMGLIYNAVTNTIVLSLGSNDRDSVVVEVSMDYVNSLLQPVSRIS